MGLVNEYLKKYFKNQKMMRTVLIALLPIIIFSIYLYGLRVLVLLISITLTGAVAEYIWEQKHGTKASEAVFVTCILYTLTLPASIPYWIAILGILFGVFFGKLVFGGFGKNVFNPALVGRAFIYVNFPKALTISWNIASTSYLGGFGTYLTNGIDAVTKATPMIAFNNSEVVDKLTTLFFGIIPGSIGETSKFLIIIAGIYLVYKKVASWEIMVSSVVSFLITSSLLFYLTDANVTNPIHGVMMGGFLFGIVFMATDPISASKTKAGKWIYGIIIGMTTVLIRAFSLFNGGMMFAILIGNTFVPIIDYFVKEVQASKKRKREVVQ